MQGDRWYTWQTWLDAIDEEIDDGNHGLVFNTYNLVLEAAIAEQGVALGWAGLIDGAVKRGQLVPACDVILTSKKAIGWCSIPIFLSQPKLCAWN